MGSRPEETRNGSPQNPRVKKPAAIGKIESDKEYGITALYEAIMPEYSNLLKKHFPEDWQTILAMAYCRQ